MATSTDSRPVTQLDQVRIRCGPQAVLVRSWCPPIQLTRPTSVNVPEPASHAAPPPALAPAPSPLTIPVPSTITGFSIGHKPVIALVQASPCGAADLALTLLGMMEQVGYRVGVICLDKQNLLGARFGCAANSPHWCWRQASAELFVHQGSRLIVPAPDLETGLDSDSVRTVLLATVDAVDAVVVDLGCRWEPRLFQPVLALATHIWFLTETGKWTALEMRLEQAEFSGWTEMARVRPVALGEGGQHQSRVIGASAVLLPDVRGRVACEFLARELGRRG
jgi:hypothetical protein